VEWETKSESGNIRKNSQVQKTEEMNYPLMKPQDDLPCRQTQTVVSDASSLIQTTLSKKNSNLSISKNIQVPLLLDTNPNKTISKDDRSEHVEEHQQIKSQIKEESKKKKFL
jgi:hypothetical protein